MILPTLFAILTYKKQIMMK